MNFLRDHQWKLDAMCPSEDEDPTCEDCGEAMQQDLFGEWLCADCEQKKQEQENESGE
jgi:tRNA(Ile2) C34 agmatinyltransferase TiaS